MKASTRARAIESSALATRLFASRPSWQPQLMSVALAAGTLLFGYAPLEGQLSAVSAGELAPVHTTAGICSDPSAKRAEREAKRAAREAKKKERAAAHASSKSDDRSLAKAKSSKRESRSSVDLGDNDPLDGL
jgi:hypothetical protein